MAQDRITKAYSIVKDYEGQNNLIRYFKSKYKKGDLLLDDFAIDYIMKNKDYIPFEVNRVIGITKAFAEKIKEKYFIDFLPTKIKIGKVIGEINDCYHCYVQYRQSVEPQLMYVSKRSLLSPLNVIDSSSIEVDFDKYDNKTPGRKIKEHQKEAVKFMLANKKCILADSMGTGKLQSINTLTPTPYGYKKFGDLKVGDKIFASDGKTHTILGVFPHKDKEIYEVEFTDGSKTNCGLEHLWLVKDSNNIRRKQGWQVKTLQELLDRGLEWKINKNGYHDYKFRIPICNPVEYPEKEYFIHPYILGVCIGDGNLCSGGIHISTPDIDVEIVERIKGLLNEDYKITVNRSATCPRYNIVKTIGGSTTNLYVKEIKDLKLDVLGGDKFIPDVYKFGSIEQRIELLRGLMDTDGSITKTKNKIRFSTKSNQLANDVIELVQSLGGLAKLHTYDRTSEGKGLEYNVSMEINICPFNLSRKKERYTIDDTHHKYLVKSIKSVKYLKNEDAVCIKVDSDDESYLTNNYIVTHNTTSSTVASMETGAEHILVITTASLKSNWRKEIELYESPDNITVINGSKWGDIKKFTIINYDIVQNFYEIATDPLYENVEVRDHDGNVVEVMKVPVMVKSKSTGEMVQKTVKSRNKDKINESLMKSPLFTNHFDCVIIDEAHKLSNNTSIRYKTIADFLQKSKPSYVFLATGTPLTNRPINLYHILKLINAEITNDYFYYVKQFCGGKEMRLRDGRTIMKMGDATNLDELREKIKHVYIRRTADEVGDMVKKEIITKRYDLNDKQKAQYDKLWNEYQVAQEEIGNDDTEEYRQLVEGMLVRQFLAKEMTSNTIDLVDELIESGEKVVIITTFQEEMDILVKHYGKKCVYYNGKMTTKAKDKAQDEFMNNPKVMVFVGQIEACGVGLNLPVSHIVIFNSYSWSEASNRQAQDRVYRLTQTKDVECVYMLFNDSVSQEMFDKVIYKGLLMDTIIKTENNKK